jgi:hypothetical protein
MTFFQVTRAIPPRHRRPSPPRVGGTDPRTDGRLLTSPCRERTVLSCSIQAGTGAHSPGDRFDQAVVPEEMARPLGGRRRTEATALPGWIKPQLTKLVDQPPDGPEWLHETKFDGYRMHGPFESPCLRRQGGRNLSAIGSAVAGTAWLDAVREC